MDTIGLIDLGLALLETLEGKLKNKVPLEVTQSIHAAIDAIAAHKNDLITKVNLEAQRG